MQALVYHGPGQRGWDRVDDPTIIDPTDIVVRIDTSTICGSDLHILKGDVPETKPGTVLGHEAVGTVVELGAGVTTVSEGDRVLMSCISACGRCRYCKKGALRSVPRGRRLDFRPPDRRPPGRVRTGSLRRQLRLPRPRQSQRRAGPVPRRHFADRL
jgi:threonine dehydrogenase-like Zn-dependent dehydrogenase